MTDQGLRVVFPETGRAELDSFPIPPPGPGEVLVRNEYTAISTGTERANLLRLPNTVTHRKGFPFHPGYSGSGRVQAVGESVTQVTPGDRVAVRWGGHRSHTISPIERVLRIEDDRIDSIDAAFAHIASFSLLGVRKLRLELGESAMIAGLGLLGVLALQFARLNGAIPVLATDPDPRRRALALRLGATAVFDPTAPDLVRQVQSATEGQGPNTAIEVTGSARALQQALEYVAWEGRIALLGCTRVSDVPIDFYKYVHRRGISLIGSHTFARAQYESSPHHWTEADDSRAFLKLLAAGRLQVRPLISEILNPPAVPAAYRRLAEEDHPPLGFVIDWRDKD